MTEFGGTKSILISTRTVMGGKNPFLGIAYVTIGGLCIVLGALFTVAHLIKPRYVSSPTIVFSSILLSRLTTISTENSATIPISPGITTVRPLPQQPEETQDLVSPKS